MLTIKSAPKKTFGDIPNKCQGMLVTYGDDNSSLWVLTKPSASYDAGAWNAVCLQTSNVRDGIVGGAGILMPGDSSQEVKITDVTVEIV
jgi:hypothetical protein